CGEISGRSNAGAPVLGAAQRVPRPKTGVAQPSAYRWPQDQQGHVESHDEGQNNHNAEQRVVNDPAQQAVMPGVVAWIFGCGTTPVAIEPTGAVEPDINGNCRVGDRRGDDRYRCHTG